MKSTARTVRLFLNSGACRTERRLLRHMVASAMIVAAVSAASAAEAEDALRAAFSNPPKSVRPRVWWHWMDGNVTQPGITKDLDWMARVGLGGVQAFDVALPTPKVVDQRLVYMTAEWKAAFRHATDLAAQHGLELAIASSPGWSQSGGPWVAPRDGMKKLVWSETTVDGGRSRYVVALPPSATGRFQDAVPLPGPLGFGEMAGPKPEFYSDVRVLAFPAPDERRAASFSLSTGDGRPLDVEPVSDGQQRTGVSIVRSEGDGIPHVILDYPAPQRVRSVTLAVDAGISHFSPPDLLPQLEFETTDGQWQKIVSIPLDGGLQTSVSFSPVVARRFRISFTPLTIDLAEKLPSLPAPGAAIVSLLPEKRKTIDLQEIRLETVDRVNRFEAKAGFVVAPDYVQLDQGLADGRGIDPATVIDLTSRMGSDGVLRWKAPRGRWKILRLGYSLTGATNHPAVPQATGLEVDKYDGEAVERYLEHYLQSYEDIVGPKSAGESGLRALLNDSIEVGPSNWTGRMLADFQRLRGYDPTPWLPSLTGTIIGSRARSNAFLFDFRQTLADLLASEYYGTVAKVAHRHGLKVYGEALELGRPILGNDLAMRRYADVPMAAMWSFGPARGPKSNYLGDIKGAASIGHIQGRKQIAAESLTSILAPWAFAPADLKPMIDLEFAYGVNLPIIHTSVHQPRDDRPGLSLLMFGQYFNRLDSWAEMARPWVDYMARSSLLLQEGRNVADIAYFFGEDAPLTQLFDTTPPSDLPKIHAYDFVDADTLLNEMSVDGGELVTKGGARYRVLYLGEASRAMSLKVLRAIARLVENGATVVGRAPTTQLGLMGNSEDFSKVSSMVWGGGANAGTVKGRAVASDDVDAALATLSIPPDVDLGAASPRDILFVHRTSPNREIYFLNNRGQRPAKIEARFRVMGKSVEIWRADSGRIDRVPSVSRAGTTLVSLEMAANDALFLVFSAPRERKEPVNTAGKIRTVSIAGPWTVSFGNVPNAPAKRQFQTLVSLSEDSDPAVRYFSGLSTYRNHFQISAPSEESPVMLALGKVGDVAQVLINGRDVGTVWKANDELDIRAAIKPGRNLIEVRVANLWVNRLIGDAQPGAAKTLTTSMPAYTADAPLRPSGLIGPVTFSRLAKR